MPTGHGTSISEYLSLSGIRLKPDAKRAVIKRLLLGSNEGFCTMIRGVPSLESR